MRRKDPLGSLRVVSPCPVPWSSMEGDDAVRFCGRCRKSVYNVSHLSRAEAIALIERAEGRVCMQLTRRSDGTIVMGDCWAQLRRARKRGLLALAAAAPAILAAQLWSQGSGLRALAGWFRGSPAPVSTTTDRGGVGGQLLVPPREAAKGEVRKADLTEPAKPAPAHHERKKKKRAHPWQGEATEFTVTVGAMAVDPEPLTSRPQSASIMGEATSNAGEQIEDEPATGEAQEGAVQDRHESPDPSEGEAPSDSE